MSSLRDEVRASSGVRIVGVSGGSGAGKSTIARELTSVLGGQAELIAQDSYYRDLSHLAPEDAARVNFDHPHAIEFDRLASDLATLASGLPTRVPRYCFETHTRSDESALVRPRPVVIVEGVLVLHFEPVRELCDLTLYVDADADVRLARRLRRDVSERGRTAESVVAQYLESVKPMHEEFVAPQQRYADILVDGNSAEGMAAGLDHALAALRGGILGERCAPRTAPA